jgi:glycerol uptake operon antiterminator
MEERIYRALEENPIIAAVRDEEGLQAALDADVRMVFVLYGDICSIPKIVGRIHEAGKLAVVHADLIVGLAAKEIAVDYLDEAAKADGVISTRPALVQRAKKRNLFAVLRVFLIDSMALRETTELKGWKPDALDLLPGLMPSVIQKIRAATGLPILTGGLITEKQEILQALQAGALAISTTDPTAWKM